MNYRPDSKSAKKEPLAAALVVNSLHQKAHFPNRYGKAFNNNFDNEIIPKTAARTKQKGKLVKCPIKNNLLVPEDDRVKNSEKPPLRRNKNTSTLNFIEKLKEIEAIPEKNGFLEQTNEEINVAFKQLEEIKKLLASKFQKENQFKREKTRHCQISGPDKASSQLERIRKQYLNKTKIRYKSLKDVENIFGKRREDSTDSDEPNEEIFQGKVKKDRVGRKIIANLARRSVNIPESTDDSIRKKLVSLKNTYIGHKSLPDAATTTKLQKNDDQCRKNKRLSNRVKFLSQDSDSSVENEKITEEVIDDEPDNSFIYKNFSVYMKDYHDFSNDKSILNVFNKTSENKTTTKGMEQTSKIGETEAEVDLLFLKQNETMNTEESILQLLSRSSMDDTMDKSIKKEGQSHLLPENKKVSSLEDWFRDEVLLEKSIAKSDYLSKEFSNICLEVDEDKATGSKQLQGTTFQGQVRAQPTNSTERDWKFNESLNIALKNTLFTEILTNEQVGEQF